MPKSPKPVTPRSEPAAPRGELEPVQCYRTLDGRLFENLESAERHNALLQLLTALSPLSRFVWYHVASAVNGKANAAKAESQTPSCAEILAMLAEVACNRPGSPTGAKLRDACELFMQRPAAHHLDLPSDAKRPEDFAAMLRRALEGVNRFAGPFGPCPAEDPTLDPIARAVALFEGARFTDRYGARYTITRHPMTGPSEELPR